MKPFTRTIIELFDGKRRYLIPLYQRQYAWKVSPQLELLWHDIARETTRLEKGGVTGAPHFMGAMVIAQVKTYGRQVPSYEVIDGQQRLSTFQLLMIALRDVARIHSPEYATEAGKYLLNDGVMENPQVERFKLWPTLSDRRAFATAVDPDAVLPEADVTETEEGVVRPATAAHAYFVAKIEAYISPGGVYDAFKLEKLFEALKTGLAVVAIELEGGDDPQTIFETLNSRGVDLSAGDLMRNFIFQRATGLGFEDGTLIVDGLYRRYWLPLDAWFWREGDTRGRLNRPRLDWLLSDHLAMMKAELVSVETLFEGYRRWIIDAAPFGGDVEAELRAIAASAAVFRRLAGCDEADVLGRFGRFSRAFDVSTATPLVLYLGTTIENPDELGAALAIIEAFIVRRDICGLPTAGYNKTFTDLIAGLKAAERPALLATLQDGLAAGKLDTVRWPNDAEFGDAWRSRTQYKPARQGRLRYLFERIEARKRANNDEIVAIKSDLTLEHIMPQKWRTHWPIPGFSHEDETAPSSEYLARQAVRVSKVDTLGNLTLLTRSLNATASNGAFSVKMPEIRAQSALVLNRELHDHAEWNEETITARGASLFKIAAQLWQAPPPPIQNA
ncbi:Protein of unknown function DUF262 [Methylobacterium phyllostachyos]|uniref:DUF262 domain-containing protein n=1 Tax=Methylobacterium phyllostachyos TaxID=582672 RepID=A0A1H0HU06_9HYPH|nr:DUF262 domain-containing protein [Methylobacterium phyllostachyos]SDO22692.1 Protein of unknown function DUF262 [Methylobacterium phyllostachyos]